MMNKKDMRETIRTFMEVSVEGMKKSKDEIVNLNYFFGGNAIINYCLMTKIITEDEFHKCDKLLSETHKDTY